MSGPEKMLENFIKEELKRRKYWYVKIAASPMMPVGIPDILACVCGHFVGIEVKRPGRQNGESAAQNVQLDNIIRSGGTAVTINNYTDFTMMLDAIEEIYGDKDTR